MLLRFNKEFEVQSSNVYGRFQPSNISGSIRSLKKKLNSEIKNIYIPVNSTKLLYG